MIEDRSNNTFSLFRTEEDQDIINQFSAKDDVDIIEYGLPAKLGPLIVYTPEDLRNHMINDLGFKEKNGGSEE